MNYIKRKRLENSWTQIDLANKLGVTQSAVAHWENGRFYPTIVILIKLSELFHCIIDELLNRELVKM